ncbi:hypothetical protein TNCV_4627811 [Trichonephila clavipes]|nr:hypothetical protein TNCV_4627811 [Trichonephila clavipes]
MKSKGRTRLDVGGKGLSLQDKCRLFARKFFFQTHQQGHEQAEELFSAYVIVHLMPNSDHVHTSMLCGIFDQHSW